MCAAPRREAPLGADPVRTFQPYKMPGFETTMTMTITTNNNNNNNNHNEHNNSVNNSN